MMDFAGIIPVIAIAIIALAAFMVVRGMMGLGRHQRMVNDVFKAALRKQLPDDDRSPPIVVCQFCGNSEEASQSDCKKCGAPLAS